MNYMYLRLSQLVEHLVSHSHFELHFASLMYLAVTGVKFLLFLYCFSYRKASSQVLVLWEDHRNDLFVNGFGMRSRFSCPTANLTYATVRRPVNVGWR